MAYKADVPGAKNMTIYNPEDEADGLKITLIESMYGFPEDITKKVVTIARIPKHDYAKLHPVWNNPDDTPDSCFLFHIEGNATDSDTAALRQNELFIETWYDEEPVNQCAIFMKMIDALTVDDEDDDDDSSDG